MLGFDQWYRIQKGTYAKEEKLLLAFCRPLTGWAARAPAGSMYQARRDERICNFVIKQDQTYFVSKEKEK